MPNLKIMNTLNAIADVIDAHEAAHPKDKTFHSWIILANDSLGTTTLFGGGCACQNCKQAFADAATQLAQGKIGPVASTPNILN